MAKIPLTHVNIIQMLGIKSLSLDERKEIVESAIELVETRTFNRVMRALPESKREELIKLLEAEDQEAVSLLLAQNQIDLVVLTEEEVEKVKQELLSETF